jgi:hypothetical protein
MLVILTVPPELVAVTGEPVAFHAEAQALATVASVEPFM